MKIMEIERLKKIIRTKLLLEYPPDCDFSVLLFDENGNKLVSFGDFDLTEEELNSLKTCRGVRGGQTPLFSTKIKHSNLLCFVNKDGLLLGQGNFNTTKRHDCDSGVTVAMRSIAGYSVLVTCSGEHDKQSVIAGINVITRYLQQVSD